MELNRDTIRKIRGLIVFTALVIVCLWKHEMVFDILILSILVDTFISKISLPMQPVPEIGSISGA